MDSLLWGQDGSGTQVFEFWKPLCYAGGLVKDQETECRLNLGQQIKLRIALPVINLLLFYPYLPKSLSQGG